MFPFKQLSSPNMSPREITPRFIILHYTAGRSAEHSIRNVFMRPESRRTPHFLIDREGAITQFGRLDRRASHAGQSRYKGVDSLNGHSVGIELDNVGWLKPTRETWFGEEYMGPMIAARGADGRTRLWACYTGMQLLSAAWLCAQICSDWGIPSADIIGHSDVKSTKLDPGPALDMGNFRKLVDIMPTNMGWVD